MKKYKNEEFAGLFSEVALAPRSLELIDKIRAFQYGKKNHPESDHIAILCQNLVSHIYYQNRMFNESLEIDLPLLASLTEIDLTYVEIINRVTSNPESVTYTERLHPFIINFLSTPMHDIGFQLHVLSWAVNHYSDNSKAFSLVKEKILEFAKILGYDQDPTLSLPDQVEELESEFRRGHNVIRNLKTSLVTDSPASFREKLQLQLGSERLAYFKDLLKAEFRDYL